MASGTDEGSPVRHVPEGALRVCAALSRASRDGRICRRPTEPPFRGERERRALQNRQRAARQLLAWRVARQTQGITEPGDGRCREPSRGRFRAGSLTEGSMEGGIRAGGRSLLLLLALGLVANQAA